ncbi:hypothetical protein PAECIP111891_00010 [Paenibacillus allorhizoplanae]|uniref:Uncharacterized protein n=1 Tax=Paenibacillus allorhizoplanae TaxID=2905648 RepID=A0ABM9BRM4_9BACL|nr:hypothetical protein PAECIP111891_00010 [Paenibacillus allorhizoplanae]
MTFVQYQILVQILSLYADFTMNSDSWHVIMITRYSFDGGYIMSNWIIRKLQQPDDFKAVAPLLNLIWSEPTTAE